MNRQQKIVAYWHLMRFDRPIGIALLLWPTLWALFLSAGQMPTVKMLLIFVLGVVLMRAAGCVINDFADRHFDGHVARTRQRPLVTAAVSAKEAIVLFFILIFLAFCLLLMLNQPTFILACCAVILTAIYPLMKRFFAMPQLVLGFTFAFGVPMAFAAQTQHVSSIAWILYGATVFWIVAFDTQYAWVDRDDDLKIGLKSSAILFGSYGRLWIAIFQAGMILMLLWLGCLTHRSIYYFLMLFLSMLLFLYQQRLMQSGQREKYRRAFLNNNYVGVLILLGLVM